VLYVDDEAAIRRAVVTWLTRRGHTVHAVRNVGEARRLLESRPVDGAFIDLWLGDESGLELQDWIDEHRPELAPNVVFVTGDLVIGDGVGGPLAQLGHPVLAKPFDLEQLDEFVARWIERNRP
jgi:DNA-binding NtrC family response regulator